MLKTTLFIITRFASPHNQRNMQFLKLREFFDKVVLVHQSKGGSYSDEQSLPIKQYPRINGILKYVGLYKLDKILNRYLYFPNPGILYVKPAQKRLAKEIKKALQKNNKVCVITALPPHELVLIGLYLKKRFLDIRWIIDWQDLWSYDENYFNKIPVTRCERVKELERKAMVNCDLNIVTNEVARNVLINKFEIPDEKVRNIPHAFDNKDLSTINSCSKQFKRNINGHLKIGFLGNLFKPPKVPGEKIISALKNARKQNINFEFHIVGDKYLEKVTRAPVKGLDWIKIQNRIDHLESLKYISSMDILLLALENLPVSKTILHAKLPFYLILNKPILAIVPSDSAVESVLKQTGNGYIIHSHQDWGKELIKALKKYNNGGWNLQRNQQAINEFSWEKISKKWLKVITGQPC